VGDASSDSGRGTRVTSSTFVLTPRRSTSGFFDSAEYERQRAFFAARSTLAASALRRLSRLASTLGLAEVWAKDESSRFGLNAFKAVGANYAIATLVEDGALAPGATVACASEGNHGRAVARAARLAGCPARVYMARSVTDARAAAIESEGATVIREAGDYDTAVREMAEEATRHGWTIVSDTAWPGYEDIPRRIMVGYTRIVDEIRDAWPHDTPPDAIFVPAGVGGLLGAVASAARLTWADRPPAVVSVEPLRAACLQASARAGTPTPVEGPFDTIMGGLRCGEVSTIGFAASYGSVDAWIAIDDEWAMNAMRQLASGGSADEVVRANASGAAATGGLLATMHDPALRDVRETLALGPASRVIVVVTEGVTDPAAFARVVPSA
jgi:diaminopropionate ammonia-lyase